MTDTKAPERKKTPAEQEKELDKQLQESFPASDVPAAVQPGSGMHKQHPEDEDRARDEAK
jgi:hypothetical protein